MTTIHKYKLQVQDEVAVELPVSAEILCVQTQNDTPCLWALVDPDEPTTQRLFRIVGTGHPFDVPRDKRDYIGTFQLMRGALDFHVFEVTP